MLISGLFCLRAQERHVKTQLVMLFFRQTTIEVQNAQKTMHVPGHFIRFLYKMSQYHEDVIMWLTSGCYLTLQLNFIHKQWEPMARPRPRIIPLHFVAFARSSSKAI